LPDIDAVELKKRRERFDRFIEGRDRYKLCSVENFEVDRAEQRNVIDRLFGYRGQFAEHLGVRPSEDAPGHAGDGVNLILHGPAGTGKDHLVHGLAANAIHAGYLLRWLNGPDLAATVWRSRDFAKGDPESVRRLVETDILYVADFGHAPLTEKEREAAFLIIDGRYASLRPTWLTMNVRDPRELIERVGTPIVDRLLERCESHWCSWPSYRTRATTGAMKPL
jgi:DNA replication protein DnaC